MNTSSRQTGVTLVEMLIALIAGLIVTGGVVTVYMAIATNSMSTLDQMKLDQQVTTLMTVMASDIRRAGYWGNQDAVDFTTPTVNPFNQPNLSALEVHAANAEVASNSAIGGECILYAYDLNDDGALDDGDVAGFRLVDGVVQMRISGDTAANPRHDACDDADDTWANVTDRDIVTITNLNFALGASRCLNSREPDGLDNDGANGVDDAAELDCYATLPVPGSGDTTVETRQITVAVAGALTGNPDALIRLNQDVRIRNDMVRTW